MKEAVVFLASGGLDSTVGMAKAAEEYSYNIYPLYIRRDSRAEERELQALKRVHAFLCGQYTTEIRPLAYIQMSFPPTFWKTSYSREDVLRLGHPMRDIMLQAIGVQYAEYLNSSHRRRIRTVMIGQTADEVIPHATKDALRLASFLVQLDRGDEAWSIRSPLLYPEPMTKADVIRWGRAHGIPLGWTWSCFEGGEEPCGKCQECIRREKAFAGAEA